MTDDRTADRVPLDAGRPLVPAMGGTRRVPAPDPIATDYLLLALRLDQRIPGLVDGYSGPAALKAQVDMEQYRPPARLRDDAAALRERIPGEVAEPDRAAWLDAQLVALEAQASDLAGDPAPYEVQVQRLLGIAPQRLDDRRFEAERAAIDRLLPGGGSLDERLRSWDRQLEIPVDRLLGVAHWLVGRFRARAGREFGLPDGEDVRLGLVSDKPWGAYAWFDGGRRSRVDVNTDLPVTAPNLVRMTAHETYPGHHLEHAWKEQDLVEGRGRLEASILLINTPECLISEGLANTAVDIAVAGDETVDLLVELFERAGLAFAGDPSAVRATAERAAALEPARRRLDAVRSTAAFLRHVDGRSPDEIQAYLRDVGGYSPASAAKRLEFIEHPLWRTYVFAYSDGEALVRRWVGAAPPAGRVARFGRLLHEQLTPAALLAEVGAAGEVGPDDPGGGPALAVRARG